MNAEGVIDKDDADSLKKEEYLRVNLDKVAFDTPTKAVIRIAEAFSKTLGASHKYQLAAFQVRPVAEPEVRRTDKYRLAGGQSVFVRL